MPGNKENSARASRAIRSEATADPDDVPELTDAMIDRAVEHRDGVPVKRGRPPLAFPKQQVTLRLDADVIAYFRGAGAGWQGRINDALRRAARLR